ncbi:hypothetical protein BH11PLA2_BH11PLA2_23930 [soil metagenome]
MNSTFQNEHAELTRRFFLLSGVAGLTVLPLLAQSTKPKKPDKAGAQPEPYFTPPEQFRDVSRGNPRPHSLSEEKRKAVGLTRDTWTLEVTSDPKNPAKLGKPLSKATNNAFDFNALIKMGEKNAVRFAKVMTCLNLGCPLGMGLWEGVPMRDVIWLTKPQENVRRAWYYGYHNDDAVQMFRSSLPINRILEDPFDLPPVILCYKLNGEWLDPERGGPVRIVVPEDYGFKSIKWLTNVVLTNLATANDTYAEQNNDVDSPLKTFAATLAISNKAKAGEAIAVSGYAQVGLSGLKTVQVSIEPKDTPRENDPYHTRAPWVDAKILPAPTKWGSFNDGKIPAGTHGFTDAGFTKTWPMRMTNAHWAAVLPGLPKGEYTFRCRTIDEKGQAQPLPRPFRKSGHNTIEAVSVSVGD